MKKMILLFLIGMMSVFADAPVPVPVYWAKHANGHKYYSMKPTPAMKPVKLKWDDFAVMYVKSWTYVTGTGWVQVDTPPAPAPSDKTVAVSFPRWIPPVRNGGGSIIVTPTISNPPYKK